jgi:hypothetical protein
MGLLVKDKNLNCDEIQKPIHRLGHLNSIDIFFII